MSSPSLNHDRVIVKFEEHVAVRLEAEDKTEVELDHLRRMLMKQGLTAQEADEDVSA